MGLRETLAQKDHKVLKVQRDHKVHRVIQVLSDLKGQMGQQDHKGLQVPQVR